MNFRDAYERTIHFLGDRKRAYQLTFSKTEPAAQYVLADLAHACHINEDCPHTDPYRLGEWMGAQRVFRRIQRHLLMTPEELFAIYSGVRNQPKETT